MERKRDILQKFITKQPMMREGGENDREMVEGIADILTQVNDPANRKAIAENMIGDFNREDVRYNLKKFLEMANVEMKNGGQHGGLDRWFAEKWVDVKTGKECGRQEGEKRKGYPACRPSKRVSEDTPKTTSELSAAEKEKFKRTKTSSERIPYQHRRKDEGGIMINDMDYMKEGGNVPTNPDLWSRAIAAAKAKYDVYPSAYANGFAAKWYKERGGKWKKAEYGGYMMPEGGPVNPNLSPKQQQYLTEKYAAAERVKQAAKTGDPNAKKYAEDFKKTYNESWTCPSGNCPSFPEDDVASVNPMPVSYTAPAAVTPTPAPAPVPAPVSAAVEPQYAPEEGMEDAGPEKYADWNQRTEWSLGSKRVKFIPTPRFNKVDRWGYQGIIKDKWKKNYINVPTLERRTIIEQEPYEVFATGGNVTPTEPIKKTGEPVPMKSMYDYAMEQYQFLQKNPEAWQGDPDMTLPDGSLNLCLDCINVDWNNPQDVRDAHRLIEEGYSTGTHYGHDQFLAGLKAAGLPEPVYGSKRPAPQKQYGGCMECGGQMAEGGTMDQQQGGIDAALNEVASMLMNGEDPADIMGQMVQGGVDEQTAQELIQEAMNRLEEDDDVEEEDVPMSTEEIDELAEDNEPPYEILGGDEPDGNEYKKGGTIRIKASKKGTFKAQATKMGMSVKEAADYILRHKEEFSPAMVKKANFARNFAKELGGELYELKMGGGIPPRYRKQGFTKVGVKRKSTRPGKKWMVLAKKGDQYKIVHGGYKGMKDYTQHHNEKRRDRFWNRMGGKDSAKARDPFSPLYWHKRFGTWEQGGELSQYDLGGNPDEFNAEGYHKDDYRYDVTRSKQVANLENNKWNRGLAIANTMGDPRNMMWALPDEGILGKVKAAAGLAAGLSGATMGYEKLFAKDKTDSTLYNPTLKDNGKTDEILTKRQAELAALRTPPPKHNYTATAGSGMGAINRMNMDEMPVEGYPMPQQPVTPAPVAQPYTGPSVNDMWMEGFVPEFAYGGMLPKAEGGMEFQDWFRQNAFRPDVMQNMSNRALLEEMWRKETGAAAPATITTPPANNQIPSVNAESPAPSAPGKEMQLNKQFEYSYFGDNAGMIGANNALAGLGMFNQVMEGDRRQQEYEQMQRRVGNTDARMNAYNPTNPFGNYTLNAGPASNFALTANTPAQDFGTRMAGAKMGGQYKQGGTYTVTEAEMRRILAMGGEIEFLD